MLRLNILIALLLLTVVGMAAHDVIACNDGRRINAKVREITPTEIKYSKATNLNGPVYTLPRTDVTYIQYENGEKEEFTTTAPANRPTIPSFRSSANQSPIYATPQTASSDAQLFLKEDIENSLNRSKLYKKIAWIGGGVIAATGITLLIRGFIGDEYFNGWTYTGRETNVGMCIIGSVTIGASAIWTGSWLRTASAQKKKAERLMYSSAPLFEQNIFSTGGTTLAAGIDVINTPNSLQPGLGLGLRLNF